MLLLCCCSAVLPAACMPAVYIMVLAAGGARFCALYRHGGADKRLDARARARARRRAGVARQLRRGLRRRSKWRKAGLAPVLDSRGDRHYLTCRRAAGADMSINPVVESLKPALFGVNMSIYGVITREAISMYHHQ